MLYLLTLSTNYLCATNKQAKKNTTRGRKKKKRLERGRSEAQKLKHKETENNCR